MFFIFIPNYFPYHPWDWHIYLHEWLICMVNVGKYTSPMDPMGLGKIPILIDIFSDGLVQPPTSMVEA